MPRIEYVPRRFSAGSQDLIVTADAICREYAAQGLDLTLRQLYYQFVARGLLLNKQTEYKRLGSVVNDARLAGLMDWNHVVDRLRDVEGAYAGYDSPADLIRGLWRRYIVNLWEGQPTRVEAWVEKDALSGVLSRATGASRVPYFACRGYVSQSALWRAAQRIEGYLDDDTVENVVILHLGDHDPSGIDMTRDITTRMLYTFLRGDGYDEDRVEVRRIALNMDQVTAYNPPPNPAKLTDSRVGGYLARFGSESWELDALNPTVLVDLISSQIDEMIDQEKWEEREAVETEGEEVLRRFEDRYDEIVAFLDGEKS